MNANSSSAKTTDINPGTAAAPDTTTAVSLPRNTPDADTGWMAAYDASTCAREFGQWGVTLANSIKRAIAAGDTDNAHQLACIQQYIFDHQFSIAAGNADAARNALDALKAARV
ncbi:MAG: hypothetical protein E6Q88_11670 [Lysobacteraceae bacterium]|nr:MAG: hypothetical protein E6Q88_11670 [Xanthomonadaceae bacterium]